jgi:hypothetical protein
LNARDSEEEPCPRATAKRNNVCPFGRRADDIDDDDDDYDYDDDDDRGRPRDEMENSLGTGHGGCGEECQEIISGDSYGETYGAMMNEEYEDDECSGDAAVRRRDAATEQVGSHVSEVVGVQGLRRSERQRQRCNIETTEQVVDVVRPEAVHPEAVRPEKMDSKAERDKPKQRERLAELRAKAKAGDEHARARVDNINTKKRERNAELRAKAKAGDKHARARVDNINTKKRERRAELRAKAKAGDEHARARVDNINTKKRERRAETRHWRKIDNIKEATIAPSKVGRKMMLVEQRGSGSTGRHNVDLSKLLRVSTSKARAEEVPDHNFEDMLKGSAEQVNAKEAQILIDGILSRKVGQCRAKWGDCGGAFDREFDAKTIYSILTSGDYHVYVGMTTSKALMSEAFTFVNRPGMKVGNKLYGNSVLEYAKAQRKAHSRPTVKEARERLNFVAFGVQGFRYTSTANLIERSLQLSAEGKTSRSRRIGIRLWREVTTFSVPPELELDDKFLARVYICVSRVDHTKMDLRAGTVHLNGVEMRIIR